MNGLKDLLEKAKKEHFAIGAFNACNLETVAAIVHAAFELHSPVIIESSPGETKFIGGRNLACLCKNFAEETGLPIYINLDHCRSMEDAYAAMDDGYDLIHFDGSRLPLEENLRIVKELVTEAHNREILIEGEIDYIEGSSEKHDEGLPVIKKTDVESAKKFVAETGVDILAVSIGNIHGVFTEPELLNFDLLRELSSQLPCYLSLHGGSGIETDQLKQGIENGIVKVNINTELRIAYRETLENVLRGNPDEYAMYKLLPPIIEEVARVVSEKIKVFNNVVK